MVDIKKYDNDFYEIFNNFNVNEVTRNSHLDDRQRMLVTLATLIANNSQSYYKIMVKEALDLRVTPIEIKEVLYQSTPYVGFAKSYDFFKITNDTFKEKGIEIPLASMKTTNSENRYEKGFEKQCELFGREKIQAMHDNASVDQKHFQDFLTSYCFGDFYTREGLDNSDRELITFALIASLGGCDDQLRGHTLGNLRVGNGKDILLSTITIICPYIGFPRTLNALNIINEICKD